MKERNPHEQLHVTANLLCCTTVVWFVWLLPMVSDAGVDAVLFPVRSTACDEDTTECIKQHGCIVQEPSGGLAADREQLLFSATV